MSECLDALMRIFGFCVILAGIVIGFILFWKSIPKDYFKGMMTVFILTIVAGMFLIMEPRIIEMATPFFKFRAMVKEVESLAEIHKTIIAAQVDDREAYDELRALADDPSSKFSSLAEQAWTSIREEHNKEMYQIHDWRNLPKEFLDKKEPTIEDVYAFYKSASSYQRRNLFVFVSRSKAITRKKKMGFFMDVIQNDKSLIAAEYAGRYFLGQAGIEGHHLEMDHMDFEDLAKWWEENRDTFE